MNNRSWMALRILLLEDDPLDAELISVELSRAFLGSETVVAGGQAQYRRALERFAPDVILSDHGVASFSSLDALRLAQRRRPGIPFFVVSGTYQQSVSDVLKSGATDFLRKEDIESLGPAIHNALKVRAPLRKLTERQIEVLQLMVGGGSMHYIARELGLSVKTVETHRAAIMKRLGIHDLAGLVRYAVRVGLISVL